MIQPMKRYTDSENEIFQLLQPPLFFIFVFLRCINETRWHIKFEAISIQNWSILAWELLPVNLNKIIK